MRNIPRTRQRFIIALAIMGVVDVALLAYLLWPGSSASALDSQRASLQEQISVLKKEVAPLEHIDAKLDQTRTNLKALSEQKVPRHSSQISLQLEKLTRETGVTTQSIKYSTLKPEKGDLAEVQRISIETTVVGDYAKVARFINALEQSELLFIIDQISLSSVGKEGGAVSLSIKFETFLKETA
jgi:Tfp pilus assembly protein PilO